MTALTELKAQTYHAEEWLGPDAAVFTRDKAGVIVQLQRSLVPGLRHKAQVVAATTAAGTLATSFENGDTVDGVVLVTGDRLLVKDQAAGADNGIYVVAASGAPARSSDADAAGELQGAVVFVAGGTVNAERTYVANRTAITLGSTAIVWTALVAIAGALTTPGAGAAGQVLSSDGTAWVVSDRLFKLGGGAITNPSSAEDLTLGYAEKACTITTVFVVVRGASPSATWTLRKGSDRSATGTEVVTGGTTTTSQAGATITSFSSATLAAGDALWLETTALSGAVDELAVIVWGKQTAP